jgi:diketogulonate reductase-like aldo/keto reductase
MNLDYIDMIIIHGPQPWKKFREENRDFGKKLILI